MSYPLTSINTTKFDIIYLLLFFIYEKGKNYNTWIFILCFLKEEMTTLTKQRLQVMLHMLVDQFFWPTD